MCNCPTKELPAEACKSPPEIGHINRAGGFIPRPAVQAVRNCSQLNRDFVEEIVRTVAGTLIGQHETRDCRSASAHTAAHTTDPQQSDTIHWRRGGQS